MSHPAPGSFAWDATHRRLAVSAERAGSGARPVANGDDKTYRYEHLSERLAEARQTRTAANEPNDVTGKPARAAPKPTGAEQELMALLGIQFDGNSFSFAGYRYDRLADAVRYARQAHGPT